MNELLGLLSNPLVWKLLIGFWIFSALVGALPAPEEKGSKFYQFVFRFAHILGGNLNRAAVTFKVPGAENGAPNDAK